MVLVLLQLLLVLVFNLPFTKVGEGGSIAESVI
jgi:hypothetical protein